MKRLFLLAPLLVACGDANSLDGSIGQAFNLEFDRVESKIVNEDLIIEYLKDRPQGDPDKVVKLVIDLSEIELGNGDKIRGDAFLEYVAIQRVAPTGGDFPDTDGGSVEFEKFKREEGATIKGKFDATFVNGQGLRGNFETDLHIETNTQ